MDILKSGKADRKLREIIESQGGNPRIRPDDIPVGDRVVKIKSNASGKVLTIDNGMITRIARTAGAPKDKGAGICLHRKMGDKVSRGDTLFEIYSEKTFKLNEALRIMKGKNVVNVGKKYSIVLEEIPEDEDKQKRYFIMER